MLSEITPIVLTYNEAPNIARTLDGLAWAREVVVLDSGSVDETVAIAARYPNVRVCTRPFDHHADQWNHALRGTGIATEWVMALDADYGMDAALRDEIATLRPNDDVSGYEIGFRYAIGGVELRGSLYPPLVVLFRRERGRYVRHGHRMLLTLDGGTRRLRERLVHDDRKPHARWLESQRRYASLEAARLRSLPVSQLRKRDWVRRAIVIAPWAVPLWVLVGLGAWRGGRAGWRYVRERATAEWLIARELVRGERGSDDGARAR